ncbi:aminoacyl-tRNA hydrolase [Mesomycoplasma neurolyticum]|uniref:Peptidyl-tRNA hydrolase n=1 Tax=Mesomycoplasma neurolyticum TaxID=2120 RepID=A0A449A5K8_9BACT|nr:aminoacyl-tRNA hydrolase [Mesomycoplasma neurolyticum]VEU59570.1 aminoacyl-tRNA hydrolase [Mesomycoplasma neurolyticum]
MKLIVGLGNPGEEYKFTRHNVGFLVIDQIAKELNLGFKNHKSKALIAKGDDFIIVKPQNYMNNSGEVVKDIVDFYKIYVDDILIILDDINIDFGKAVIKNNGSAGGQKGMQNIIDELKTKDIKRMKIGISRPMHSSQVKNYVLSNFTQEEKKLISAVIEEAALAAIEFISNDIRFVIEKFNAKNRRKKVTVSS